MQPNRESAKSFEEIPRVTGLPFVGTLFWYLPYIGVYNPFKLHIANERKLQNYGPIVRETIMGRTYVLVYDPEDIARVFKSESKYPYRETLLSLKEYRVRKHSTTCDPNAGLIVTQGQNWLNCRSVLNAPLLKSVFISPHVNTMDDLALGVVKLLEAHPEEDDVHETMYLWALENATRILLGKQLGALESSPSRECQETVAAIRSASHAVGRLEFPYPPLWRWIATHNWNEFERNEDLFRDFIVDCVEERLSRPENTPSSCDLLSHIIREEQMKPAELITSLTDLVFAAVDTTAFAASFAMHFLALNPRVQEKARQEAVEFEHLDLHQCKRLSYLQAVIKETLRLRPVVPGVFRISSRDLTLSGFKVPAGTKIFTQNHVACLSETNFPRAREFLPERWAMPTSPSAEFASLPFGSGKRACIGRRLAETTLLVFLVRLLQTHVLDTDDKEIDIVTSVVSSPENPIRIKFRPLQ
ncbi:cytochrome P450 302a1, mitochondrial-like [Galendromus occidentalis]|uniref:Cytochrome P450 302a1, mitochondrial-like n=1 Tax=Galendromus occidentalis TaxID=34638 RepID=A0AAJ6QVB3_9ACAR|nr:cytochrome P450 302a1, mitochondrial-like [Galendromus occidentalis]